jgi:hypothetical protein
VTNTPVTDLPVTDTPVTSGNSQAGWIVEQDELRSGVSPMLASYPNHIQKSYLFGCFSTKLQIGLAQVELPQVGLAQVGLAQVGLAQVGLAQVGLAQVGLAQVGLAQNGEVIDKHYLAPPY